MENYKSYLTTKMSEGKVGVVATKVVVMDQEDEQPLVGSYWYIRFFILFKWHLRISRNVFLSFLGVVYLFAFISLNVHVIPLFGDEGISPISQSIKQSQDAAGM